MMLNRLLRRDNKGIGAVEFALVAPVLISFVIGISQMGKLFYASADMKNALATGARVASIWPVPQDDVILAAVNEQLTRTGAVDKAEVDITRGQTTAGNNFVEIEMSYQVPLEFIFFDIGPVELNDTRMVFTQMAAAGGGANPGGGGGTTSTSTTSAGGTTSTGGDTSTGGTTSTGGDTSTGGTTTGGTTSTGGTTTTTGGSTTTSSSGSSGKHNHGNCKKKC